MEFIRAPDHSVQTKQSKMSVRLCMWEFGQNDPKRDSGSKMRRLGYASQLKLGQAFQGIVLSSEATTYVTKEDAGIIAEHGIAGINCSWNRLDEIPFDRMGKGRHQRILPKLLAANSVNYGKPFKMNTAEAMAATLYIAGFQEQARIMLEPFSYGEEFLRLNATSLDLYCQCKDSATAEALQLELDGVLQRKESANEARKEQLREHNGCIVQNYLSDMDLPPMDDEDEEGGYYTDGDEEEEEEVKVDSMGNIIEPVAPTGTGGSSSSSSSSSSNSSSSEDAAAAGVTDS